MPTSHATLGPSGASRWIGCPASVMMSQKLPKDDRGSVYAQEGTFAHTLGEIEAGLFFGLITRESYAKQRAVWEKDLRDEYGDDAETKIDEMEGYIADYVQLIKDHSEEITAPTIFLEQRVDTGVPNCWGTSDTVIVGADTIEIIDLKYGQGVAVDPVANYQLMLYALGACKKFDSIVEPKTVRITVFQPRIYNTGTWEVSYDYLKNWREEVAKPAAKEALGEDPHFGPSESACRFCPAAGICKARADKVLSEDFGQDPTVLSPEDVSEILKRVPEIRSFCDDIQDSALARAYQDGETIPGWKVVQGAGRRAITDQAVAIQRLIDEGYSAEQVSTVKIAGIGALEKLLGKEVFKEKLGDFVVKNPGKPCLVPAEDKRKAITRNDEAVNDFGKLD